MRKRIFTVWPLAIVLVVFICVSVGVWVTGGLNYLRYGDLAERIPLSPHALQAEYMPQAAEIVQLNSNGLLERCTNANSVYVVGVVSTNPAHILRGMIKDSVAVALSGVVPCRVTSENGRIRPGDLIVSSSTPGAGMRARGELRPGSVIGKALEGQVESQDVILVLVMLR